MNMRIVYTETWIDPDALHHDDLYSVFVEVRRYEGKSARESDVVMRCHLIVNGEAVVYDKKILDSYDTDAALQRQGIAKFDELLHAYPAWARVDLGEAEVEL